MGECPFILNPSQEEEDGLRWLQRTLQTIIRRKGKNAGKAQAVFDYWNAAHENLELLHDRVHDLEDLLVALGYRAKPRTTLPREMN
jgi:hypothetical protein